MVNISIEAQVSTEQLLRAVEQLPPQEFGAFITDVLALRAKRIAPRATRTESQLLQQINRRLGPHSQQRFDTLVVRRKAGLLTDFEKEELVTITDQIEQSDAQRIIALDELAHVRGVSLADLMINLGLADPQYG